MVFLTQALALALLAVGTFAHPGESLRPDIRRRVNHLKHNERRSVTECTKSLHERGWINHQADRRHAKLNELRTKAGYSPVTRRDPDLDVELFGRQAGCVLDPEVTEGPYWVAGELIRQDLLPGVSGIETGVVVHLDINIIDVSTCEPVPDAFVELWGCNSTGVYTGVVASGNGDGSASEINNNALRGLQPTAENGTATFISVVPGHYVGRTNHLHTIIHHGATRLENDTISGGTISHVGQLYFEQTLLESVEQTVPYSTNTQEWTQNAVDQLFQMGFQGGDDPVVQVQMIGSTIEEGLYGTIDVGVNPAAVQNPSNVNWWTANGGVPNTDSMWTGYPWENGGGPFGGFGKKIRAFFKKLF
ncbi:hypothetical protein FQN53_006217 [Emmonsiellopsis sp. PD_33]|nr:hypothetical protein FQN53_006217 [Emmonsiellopsis sp. PD_33]